MSHSLREIANLEIVVLRQREPKVRGLLQETHRNSTSYTRDKARTSERLLDRQTP